MGQRCLRLVLTLPQLIHEYLWDDSIVGLVPCVHPHPPAHTKLPFPGAVDYQGLGAKAGKCVSSTGHSFTGQTKQLLRARETGCKPEMQGEKPCALYLGGRGRKKGKERGRSGREGGREGREQN